MSNDDLTHNLSANQEDDKATQPTITAVFRLLQDLDKRFNARFEALENRLGAVETRLDQLETRLSRDFVGIDAHFVEMSNEMKSGFIQLSDKLADQMDHIKLHHDADYQDLLRRMRQLESKAS
ncbi:MAG: hypothetical protein AABN33_23380 [Acidobacteriota bacterium]